MTKVFHDYTFDLCLLALVGLQDANCKMVEMAIFDVLTGRNEHSFRRCFLWRITTSVTLKLKLLQCMSGSCRYKIALEAVRRVLLHHVPKFMQHLHWLAWFVQFPDVRVCASVFIPSALPVNHTSIHTSSRCRWHQKQTAPWHVIGCKEDTVWQSG